jgi:hypothetical protein
MNHRLLSAVLLLPLASSLACGSKSSGAGAAGKGGSSGGSSAGSGGSGAGGSSAGAGGNTGTGGSGSGGTTGTGGSPASTGSVLERGNHPSKDANYTQPALTKAAAATMARDAAFMANFTGSMWASPVYLENGPNGKGVFFAVTTGNDVYALDETTGAVVWMKNIGSSPTANGVNCGSIHPLGILSTPVIDASKRTIYVAGAIGTTMINSHQVHALSVDDGTEKTGWPVDVTGTLQFTAPAANQRSALSLVNGILYVAYGGHVGDCGDYRGRVVAINTADPTQVAGWATGGQGEAIWAAGGMASDGTSVFAATGNNTARVTTHADSEEIVRISGMATFTRSNQNLFFPSRWNGMDGSDADVGSSNPVYLTISGATPSNVLAALSKDGHFYLLDAANLGGSTALADVTIAMASNSMAIWTAPTAYQTATGGMHVALQIGGMSVGCPGNVTGRSVMSVSLSAASPPKPTVAWCAAMSGNTNTSPISTTTDGKTDALVWIVNNGTLNAFDGDTGAVVYNGSGTSCTNVRQWTSPIAVKGRIVVGGDGHLCSWSPH